jgi:hypothetical protein
MPNIVAAEFDDFKVVDAALSSLSAAGFAPSEVDTYFLNASGQHARFPIGGDQDEDPEAHGAEKGALAPALRSAARPGRRWASSRRRLRVARRQPAPSARAFIRVRSPAPCIRSARVTKPSTRPSAGRRVS